MVALWLMLSAVQPSLPRTGNVAPASAVPPAAPAAVASSQKDSTVEAPPTSQPAGSAFNFQAVDALDGKAIAGAKIMTVSARDPQHIDYQTNLVTDSTGRCLIPMSVHRR